MMNFEEENLTKHDTLVVMSGTIDVAKKQIQDYNDDF